MLKNLQRLQKSLSSAAPPKKTIEKKAKPTKTTDEEKAPSTSKTNNASEESQLQSKITQDMETLSLLESKLGQCMSLLSRSRGDTYYKLVIQILEIAMQLGYDTGFKLRGSVQMTLCATINLPDIGWVFYPLNPPKSKDPECEVSDETTAKRTDLFIKTLEKQDENEDGYVLIGGMHEDQSPDQMQMWLVPNNDPKHQEMVKYLREVGLDEKYCDFLLFDDGLKEYSVEFPVNVKITEFIGLGFTV